MILTRSACAASQNGLSSQSLVHCGWETGRVGIRLVNGFLKRVPPVFLDYFPSELHLPTTPMTGLFPQLDGEIPWFGGLRRARERHQIDPSTFVDMIAALPSTLRARAQGVAGFKPTEAVTEKAHSALCGGQGCTARTAKARVDYARFPASGAEKGCGGRLWRGCRRWHRSGDLPRRVRGERHNQRNDPADERPTEKQIHEQNCCEVGLVARQEGGQKVQEQRHKHEKRMEMEKGEEPYMESHHTARSTMAYRGVVSRIDSILRLTGVKGGLTNPSGCRPAAKCAPCVFPSDVFYLSSPNLCPCGTSRSLDRKSTRLNSSH